MIKMGTQVCTKLANLQCIKVIRCYFSVFVVVIGLWDPSKLITPTDWEHYSRYWLRCYEEVEYQIRAVGMRNITQFTTIVDFYWPNKRKQLWPQTVTLWRQLLLDSINYYPRNIYLAYFINSK